jgi:hypothetical protein
MSHAGHPTLSSRSQLRAHWIAAVSALVALLAAAAVTLILVVDNGASSATSSVANPQPALRSDGGPNESAVAASIAPRPVASPDESTIAASVGGPRMLPSGPDDTATVASAPDESAVAESITGH